MNFETAIKVLEKHSTGSEPESFSTLLLDWQVSGTPSIETLELIYGEIVDALQSMNIERQRDSSIPLQHNIVQAVADILSGGWDSYSWWTIHKHLPQEFLVRLAGVLSDWGFAWSRILDGSTPNLKEALEARRVN